jgi:DNA-binding CsgD family transcriptional regulator
MDTITSNGFTGFLGRGAAQRELECILEIAAGYSSKQAAQRLGCSPNTVEKAVERVFFKLRVSSRAALIAEAFKLGLIAFSTGTTPSPQHHHDQEPTNGVFIA